MTDRRLPLWWFLAALLATAGVAAVVVRPVAPETGAVVTDLHRFSPAVLAAVEDYRGDRYLGALAILVVSVAVPAFFVFSSAGRRLVDATARRVRRPYAAVGVVAALIAAATAVVELPLRFWVNHVHERRWGFATAPAADWFRDWAIVLGLTVLVAVVAAIVLVASRRRWSETWHLRVVPIGTVLTGLLVFVYPLLIQPLLLPTRPLPDGDVRRAVTEVLEQAGTPELGILVGDASRRTTKVNAFVAGIGPSRQVVLYDTLLELPPEQIAVVVAHELAHRQHHDIARSVLASATGLLVGAVLLRRVLRTRAGRPVGDARAVAILLLFLAGAQVVAAPLANWASRRAESSADHRALELTGAAARQIATYRSFVVRDLADPTPPGWAMGLWGTHPSIHARIEAAVAFAREAGVRLPDRAELTADEPPPRPRPAS